MPHRAESAGDKIYCFQDVAPPSSGLTGAAGGGPREIEPPALWERRYCRSSYASEGSRLGRTTTEGSDALSEIDEWLEGLGLSEYAAVFRENDIDYDILAELTEADLKELGLSLGHRRRVLRAINALRGPQGEDSEAPASYAAPAAATADRDLTAFDRTEPAGEAFPDGRPTFAILVIELRNLADLDRHVHPLHLGQLREQFQDHWTAARERWNGIQVKDHASQFVAYFGPSGAPSQPAAHAVGAAQDAMQGFRQLAEKISETGDPPPRAFWTCRIGIDCGQVPGEVRNGDLRDLMADDPGDAAPSPRSARIASLNESIAAATVSARLLTEIADDDTIVVSERAHALLKDDFRLSPQSRSGVEVTAYRLSEDEPLRPAIAAPEAIASPLFNHGAPKVRSEPRGDVPAEPRAGSPLPAPPLSAYAADAPGGGQAATIRKLEDESQGSGGWLSPLAIFFTVIIVGLPILAFVFKVDFLVSLFEFLQSLIA